MSKTTSWVTVVVLLLGIVGVWYYFNSKNNTNISNKNTKIQELEDRIDELELASDTNGSSSDEDISDLKTYTNTTLGFTFKYPSDYSVDSDNLIASKSSYASAGQKLSVINGDKVFSLWVNPDGWGPFFPDYSYSLIEDNSELTLSGKTDNNETENDIDYFLASASSGTTKIFGLTFLAQYRNPIDSGSSSDEFEKFFTDFTSL